MNQDIIDYSGERDDMLEVQGYRTIEQLGNRGDCVFYRLASYEDGTSVIAKTLRDVFQDARATVALREEYERLRELEGRGALKAIGLEKVGERLVVLLEDIGGQPMSGLLETRETAEPLSALVRVAVSAADSLMRLHRENIVLFEVSPSHLWANVDTGEAKFADIRNSANSREPIGIAAFDDYPRWLRPYLSPEHTGRTGDQPDYRSDLYGLGMTFYEWFSGKAPFEPTDDADMLYRHLAVAPQPLHRDHPDIPETLSRIVAKCVEKSPEFRYQSAYGLKTDLADLLAGLEAGEEAPLFEPGRRDIPLRPRLPEKLYGRDAERKQVQEALDRARAGAAEVVELQGGSGIGKTFFVQQTLGETEFNDRRFVTGKFEANRNVAPYEGWIGILQALTDRLLTSSLLDIEFWKLRMMNALDGYGQLLIERVPRLELLIGAQPEASALPPAEARRRFHLLLNRFFQAFASHDQPLVLFLDDVQWADEASLHYLADLIEDRGTRHVLIVLACRDEEAALPHALAQLRERLTADSEIWTRLQLAPLGVREAEALLSDTLLDEHRSYAELAAALLRKTDGNPLFLKQMLLDLFEARVMFFNEDTDKWAWNFSQIEERGVADDTANYMSEKLKHMPEQLVEMLSVAAFLGNPFELEQLKVIVGLDEQRLIDSLEAAVREGLLQVEDRQGGRFRFQHDRIQQAAYAVVPEEERAGLHYRIGSEKLRLLRETAEFDEFQVVYHLNRAVELLDDRQEERLLAELNLRAAFRAKQATAYETALDYLDHAARLLGDADWDKEYGLLFQVYRERAELEYLCLRYDEASTSFRMLLGKAVSKLDQAVVYNLMMRLEASLENRAEVIGLATETLALLNVRLPRQIGKITLIRQLLRVGARLRKHSAETIFKLPPMKDETSLVAMKTLDVATNALFHEDKESWLAYTLTLIDLTLDRGLAPESCSGFVGYALYLYYSTSRLDETYRWGMLACELSKPYPMLRNKMFNSFQICLDSWRKHDPEMLEVFTEYAGKMGIESGDVWHGNQSVLINCVTQFNYGFPISGIYERLLEHAGEFRRHRNDMLWKQVILFASMLTRLSGYRSQTDAYPIEEVEKSDYATTISGDSNRVVEMLSYICDYICGYIFEEYEEANEALRKARKIAAKRKDNSEDTLQLTYEALVWLQLYEALPAERRGERWSAIRRRRNRLRKHARQCPMNYMHKLYWIDAEMARLKGKHRLAEELYAKSIEAARESGHIHDLAMAAECCGKYELRQGKTHWAKVYLTEAYEAYKQWGAYVKAEQMERKYNHLLQLKPQTGLERIDYLSVVQSVQAISGEMEMEGLLNKLMRIMLHNSGAEFGALLFAYDGGWVVEAYGTLEKLRIEPVSIRAIPAEQYDEMPAAVIGYAVRTGETIVLHDAAREGLFVRNPYIRNKGVRSVLCLPIRHQNKIISMLYLENRLSSRLFTPQRLELVELLSSQCAVSITNAKLFEGIQDLRDNLEEQVEQRSRSLERAMLETSAALAEASVYEERNRIAQEIHDIVGHTLTSTVIQIEAGKRLMRKNTDEATERLKEAQDLVRHGLNEIRGSVHMLKEDKYADLGGLLTQLIRDTERNTGVAIRSTMDEMADLPGSHKKMLYHALQEGLTNGIRHGASPEFRFSLNIDAGITRFRLQDYGKGASGISPGFGLRAMKDRAEQLGGSLTIEARLHEGCLLCIDLPNPKRRMEDGK